MRGSTRRAGRVCNPARRRGRRRAVHGWRSASDWYMDMSVRAADRLLQALGTCRRWEWTTVLFLAHADAIAHSHLPRAQQAANENCSVLVPKYQYQAEGLSAAKIHRLHWRHSGSVAVAAPAGLDFHRKQSPGRGRRGCIRNGRWQGIGIDGSAACYVICSSAALRPSQVERRYSLTAPSHSTIYLYEAFICAFLEQNFLHGISHANACLHTAYRSTDRLRSVLEPSHV